MLGLFGLIKKNLDMQNKLPAKYYDEIPSSPVTSGCILYVDAINNTGSGHSNSATTWTPIIGSTAGTKVGSPIWHDDCVELDVNGFYFQKLTSNPSAVTYECVVKLVDAEATYIVSNIQSGGGGLYLRGDANPVLGFCADSSSGALFYKENMPASACVGKMLYLCGRADGTSIKFYDSLSNMTLTAPAVGLTGYTNAPFVVGYNPGNSGAPDSSADLYPGKKYLYSARVYNRALTDEEMKQNMLYDKARFNF